MKKIYLIFILIPFFSIAQKLEGQPKIDSLLIELPKAKVDTIKVNILNLLALTYNNLDANKGMQYHQQALKLSQKINFKFGLSTAYRGIAANYAQIADYDKAFIYFNIALKYATNSKAKGKIFTAMGYTYNQMNNYPAALNYLFKALEVHEKNNDLVEQTLTLNNIGTTYNSLKNPKKAIVHLEKALLINKKLNLKTSIIRNLNNLGTSYSDLTQHKKALKYFEEAIKIADEIGQTGSKTISLYSCGLSNFMLKNYDKSLEFSKKSLLLSEETGNKMGLIKNYGLIGHVLFEKAKIEKNILAKNNFINNSIINLNKAINISIEIDEIVDLSINYDNLSKVEKIKGNYKASLEAHEQYVIYKDSVFNSENKETIKNLEDKREIELRDKQLKINKLSLEAKEKQKWLFVAGIGFLAIIGGLLFYQSRKRKLTNLKLETLNKTLDKNNLKLENLNKDLDQANKAKTRFFGILNHDLRGPVSNLVIFLQLQQEAPEMLDEESIKRMQDKTMTGAKNLLASMEDILQWSKSQMENFKPQPKNVSINQLFDDTKKVFSGYLNIKIDYQNPDDIEIFTDDNYLKTIIRNLTSNAINVLAEFVSPNEKQIIWKAWQKDKISYLSITDNGPGANPEKLKALFEESELGSTKSGLGLHLIRDMANAINCEISVESTIGIGTTFVLKLN